MTNEIPQDKAREYQQMACIMHDRLSTLAFMADEDCWTLDSFKAQVRLHMKDVDKFIEDAEARERVYNAIVFLASIPQGMIRSDAIDENETPHHK